MTDPAVEYPRCFGLTKYKKDCYCKTTFGFNAVYE